MEGVLGHVVDGIGVGGVDLGTRFEEFVVGAELDQSREVVVDHGFALELVLATRDAFDTAVLVASE